MKKRAKLEIVKDILTIIKEEGKSIRFTPLLRRSNLSSSRFKEYFEELKVKGLIKEYNLGRVRKISLTENGMNYLDKYQTIIRFIDEFDL